MSDGDGGEEPDELDELFDDVDRDREADGFDWLDDVDVDADGSRRPGPDRDRAGNGDREADGPTPEDGTGPADGGPGAGGQPDRSLEPDAEPDAEPDVEPVEEDAGVEDPFVPGPDGPGGEYADAAPGPATPGGDAAESGDGPGVPDPEDPFGEPDARGDPFESGDSVFRRQEVGEVDPDEVWERLSEMEAGGSVGTEGDSVYAEVSKHSYCEQCEFFSEPPEVACTHETGEIIEFLDMETVRLLNCPVVAERRELEREG